MQTVLVTGSSGFIGRNLVESLRIREAIRIRTFDLQDEPGSLERHLDEADIIYHLAGVNRPSNDEEFESGNAGLTSRIIDRLLYSGRRPLVVLSSSTQADFDNPYGRSKKKAEELLLGYARETGGPIKIFRLPNVFGKWCRPNYNSVVATFCHNIAHGLPISISDPQKEITLVYIDDVVSSFSQLLTSVEHGSDFGDIHPRYVSTLGEIADYIGGFREMRSSLVVPDLRERFIVALYATYLSYLESDDFAYELVKKTDQRGSLAELLKSSHFGQIFISRTKPGITRGNHYHHLKTEKFCVVEGVAIIRFRHIQKGDVIEYRVRGEEFKVVDIPPGYTHSIENIGTNELVTLFWASQQFDPQHPDTYSLSVIDEQT